MTYNVFGGTLSLTQSINQSAALPHMAVPIRMDGLVPFNLAHPLFP